MKNIGKSLLYALPLILVSIAVWHMASQNDQLKHILLIELYVAIAVLFAAVLIFGLIISIVYLKSAVYYAFKIDVKLKKNPT